MKSPKRMGWVTKDSGSTVYDNRTCFRSDRVEIVHAVISDRADLSEMFGCHFSQDVVEVTLVLIVDETVVEHSQRLVAEESEHLLCVPDIADVALQDTCDRLSASGTECWTLGGGGGGTEYQQTSGDITLHTFGEISEVEDVVRFGWCWQQLGGHPVINLDGGSDDSLGHLLHRLREVVEKSVEDSLHIPHTYRYGESMRDESVDI